MSSEMPKRVLVTGAAGRLGSRVTALLHARGHQVLATDVRPAPDEPWRFVMADLLDHTVADRLVDGVDVVVHLGNHPGIGPVPPQIVLSENLTMNANVFQAAAEHCVGRIVFAGTIQLIGSHVDERTVVAAPQPPLLPLDGSTEPAPSNLYALSKTMSETMLRYYADRCGIDVGVLRFPLLHNHEPRISVATGEESPIDVFELFTGLSYADAAAAVAAVIAADRPGYRVYVPALPHRHRDLGEDDLIRRFYPDAPGRGPRLVDSSALTHDTGWQPSDEYQSAPSEAAVVPNAEVEET